MNLELLAAIDKINVLETKIKSQDSLSLSLQEARWLKNDLREAYKKKDEILKKIKKEKSEHDLK